ncbi:uncharacterized protein LOC116602164 [Nematostella vectensis]|uniref:uncharacterized protein LOC116602164 n=1 Tax=Nematostella vectensis TaxID=45351 RepID=UPI0020772EED|nr:uncharacterized protein LOC116602164 [Nematostella vectensis]
MCEMRFIVAFLLLMVIPADCAVCPDASLQKCLDLIPSTTACDVAKSWLHTQNSPVTAKICDQQRQSMEASCKSICPSVSCTACFQKVHKAVAECVDFFAKIQTSTSSCEVLKRNLIQHCTQPKICKACKNSFCQNGGSCHTGPTPHVISCKCPKGFTGIYC